MAKENEKFKEIVDWGDRKFFIRDFGYASIEGENGEDKDIPLVLVAEIMDYYEATGDDKFEKEPFGIDIAIYPNMDFIDEAHIESCAKSAGIEPEEVHYSDLVGYIGGIPLLDEELEKSYKEMDDAEKFLMSDELRKKLNARSAMIGFYLDGAINRIGNTRWSFLEYMVDKKKDFYRQ